MSTPAIIAICVLLALAGAVVLVPPWLEERAKKAAVNRCSVLEARLRGASIQGGDVQEQARLIAELRACAGEAAALGGNIDPSAVTLTTCESRGEQISQEWAHYLSTSRDDAVKRNNTRGTWLRLVGEMARCYEGAIAEATTVLGMQKIIASLDKQVRYSAERQQCFHIGDGPCSRAGVNEPHNNERAADERDRGTKPLTNLLESAKEKMKALQSANPSASASTLGVSARSIAS